MTGTAAWPLPHAYYTEVEFLFRVRHVKKWAGQTLGGAVSQNESGGERVDYLLELPMTKTIPGRTVGRLPLSSFKASTVML